MLTWDHKRPSIGPAFEVLYSEAVKVGTVTWDSWTAGDGPKWRGRLHLAELTLANVATVDEAKAGVEKAFYAWLKSAGLQEISK